MTSLWNDVWTRSRAFGAEVQAVRARHKVRALDAVGLEVRPSTRVLDVGCGSSDLLGEIARAHGDATWMGCDRSAVGLRRAAATLGRDGRVLLVRADAERLPFRSASFDTVLAMMLLQHVDSTDAVLLDIDRVLADGGRLFVMVPNRRSVISFGNTLRRAGGRMPHDLRQYTPATLCALLRSRFDVDACRTWHAGRERRVLAAIDRTLGRLVPASGRYLVARCRKRASGGPGV